MLLRPWLFYYRRRLITAAIFSVVAACLTYMWVTADGFSDVGVFWHSFCGCPVDPDDAHFLLNNLSFDTFILAIIFGFLSPGATNAGTNLPEGPFKAIGRFFLTRPISRSDAFLVPQAIALASIALLPLLAFLLLFGWLRLVHAPSLHHLLATLQVIPAASALGPHPTLVQLLGALSAARRYLAAVSVGFSAFAILASQQWLMLSANKKLNALGVLPLLLLFVPATRLMGRHASGFVFLAPNRDTYLTYLPSTLAISLHFAVAAAVLYGCWRIFSTAEL
jgi:hypothetical protein